MDAIALHLEVRNAIELADELARHEHALRNEALASYLGGVRATLAELERKVGRSHAQQLTPRPALIDQLAVSFDVLRRGIHGAPLRLRPRLARLVASLERIVFAERQPGQPLPALPVLGGLPIGRIVPQAVHSLVDLLACSALLTSAKLARGRRARVTGLLLGWKLVSAALVSDVHLAPIRRLPVEIHEMLDHGIGLGAMLAPLLLGYRKKDRAAAHLQMLVGAALVAVSLLTDYRAEHGVGRPIRSRGGPFARGRRRVPEAQRPLEGFASPSVLPRIRV